MVVRKTRQLLSGGGRKVRLRACAMDEKSIYDDTVTYRFHDLEEYVHVRT